MLRAANYIFLFKILTLRRFADDDDDDDEEEEHENDGGDVDCPLARMP